MTRPLPQLRNGRDGPIQQEKLVNEMRRYSYVAPGVAWTVSDEDLDAFLCVGRNTDVDQNGRATDNLILARADSTNPVRHAVGVLAAAVKVGELGKTIYKGIVLGAVSGRTAGDPVWVGVDGTLVFSPPSGAGYTQQIAVCVSDVDIYVDASSAPGLGNVLGHWSFVLRYSGTASALILDPRWLAPAHDDGEIGTDDVDERGFVFVSPTGDAYNFSFFVRVFTGDAVEVDSGVWQWTFTLMKNSAATAVTAVITSGVVGQQLEGGSGFLAFTSGDNIGVQVVGEQVSGASTTGTVIAFVTLILRG